MLAAAAGFRTTLLGRLCTRMLVTSLETLGIAPSGTGRVASFLERAGDSLVAGGKTGIFTPMFFFLARKPVEATPLRAAAAKAAGATATITTSSATKSR